MPNTAYLDEALATAVRAVRSAAQLLRRHRYDPPPPRAKADGSAVTVLDVKSENLMRRIIRSRYPDHTILGEECALEPGTEGWLWYLDPLDGTRVYSSRQDTCCSAATLTHEGIPWVTAVAVPFTSELFTAVRGRPSRVNGRSLRVAPARPLRSAEFLLYYDTEEEGLSALLGAARRGELGRLTLLPGSFILNACRAAKGAYDVYLCVKRRSSPLMPWDLLPAALVLAGAGGVMTDLESWPQGGMIPSREIVAGSPPAVEQAISCLGVRIRDPRPGLAWARRNEAVFARLCSQVITRGEGCVVGIAGAGGGIGKTSLACELRELLGPENCTLVALDDYLIPRVERDAKGMGAHDAAANDLARAAADLRKLRSGESCQKPVYDHTLGRSASHETLSPSRFLLLEGVHALHPTFRPLLDLGIFLDATPAVRYRRVARDMEEKGVSEAYARSVHERLEEECRRYLLPLKETADVVIRVDETFHLVWVSPQ